MPLPTGQHRTDGRLYVGSVAADIDLEALGLLDAMGTSVLHIGAAGSGHAAKALNNYVSAAGLAAAEVA